MGGTVSRDFFVDDVVVALAGVREDQIGAIVRSRRLQLVPRLRRRVPAELRGEHVRVRWDRDKVATWYPAPLLTLSHVVSDRMQRG